MKTNLLITLTALILVGCGNNPDSYDNSNNRACIEGVTYLTNGSLLMNNYAITVMLDTNSKVIRCKND